MKELFDRHQDRLSEAEDRRVWGAVRDAVVSRRSGGLRRWSVPAALTAVAGAVVVALVARGPDRVTDLSQRQESRAVESEAPAAGAANEATEAKRGDAPEAVSPEPVGSQEVRSQTEAPVSPPSAPGTMVTDEMEPWAAKSAPSLMAGAESRANVEATAGAGSIRGRVTNAQGRPLVYANVIVEGTNHGAMADSTGRFVITDLAAGTYTLKISYLGYEPAEREVQLAEGTELAQDFAMNEDKVTLMEKSVLLTDLGSGEVKTSTVTHGIGDEELQRLPAGSVEGLGKESDASRSRGKKDEKRSNSGLAAGTLAPSASAMTDAARMSAPAPAPPDSHWPISVGGTDPVNGQAFDSMFFKHYGVNPFIDPQDDALSTFAVDVDNASYSMARSYLERGELPPDEAIRVEEFVNAFDHGYRAPRGRLVADRRGVPSEHGTFAIYMDAAPSPFGQGLTLLRVGLKGREIDAENRKPAVLTFVVDVSGSMAREDRLELVKKALYLLLDQTRPDDEVGLVVYGTDARVILPHTSARQRERIESAIASLVSEGSTNAEAGLREAYALADRGYREGWINRVILCSDGVANVGETGADGILGVIKREARRGIYLTAAGFGMGNYNDVLMEQLANQADGNYYYVDDLPEARRVFVENLTGTLQTIAREVKIQVEFDSGKVRRYRLLGYENRDVADRDFRNDAVDAGEVGAGHEVTALFEMKLEKAARQGKLATVRIRYEDPESGQVTEEERSLRVEDVAARIEKAEATFQMDAAVAEFAEILRRSYWAKEGDLAPVVSLAQAASRRLGHPADVEEMVRLAETAWKLEPRGEEPDWQDGPRPQWEPEGEER